jgi:hypothetical protein
MLDKKEKYSYKLARKFKAEIFREMEKHEERHDKKGKHLFEVLFNY